MRQFIYLHFLRGKGGYLFRYFYIHRKIFPAHINHPEKYGCFPPSGYFNSLRWISARFIPKFIRRYGSYNRVCLTVNGWPVMCNTMNFRVQYKQINPTRDKFHAIIWYVHFIDLFWCVKICLRCLTPQDDNQDFRSECNLFNNLFDPYICW